MPVLTSSAIINVSFWEWKVFGGWSKVTSLNFWGFFWGNKLKEIHCFEAFQCDIIFKLPKSRKKLMKALNSFALGNYRLENLWKLSTRKCRKTKKIVQQGGKRLKANFPPRWIIDWRFVTNTKVFGRLLFAPKQQQKLQHFTKESW